MNLEVPVSEIMTRNIVSVTPNQRLADVKTLFAGQNFHYNVPVIEDNKLKGMVVLTDFMFAINHEPAIGQEIDYAAMSIKDIMREKVPTLPSTATVREVAGIFSSGETHTLMIVDDGVLKGIISPADIIRRLLSGQK